MSSELLTRLASLAAVAPDEGSALKYRAQWACAAARLGKIAAARTEIASLRAKNSSYSPELTAWIFIAEGMVDHFESLSSTALDRFKRAYGLGAAIGNAEVRSMAAAWMGASEYLVADYQSAARHALEAIQSAPEGGALARARAHLVVANCFNAAGDLPHASVRYAKARQSAIEARDISMQSLILFNVANFHVSNMSLCDAFGESVEAELGAAELEVGSISNLDSGLGLESLRAMVPLLRAQLHLIGRRWSDAEALYSEFTAEGAAHGLARHAPRYLAEHAHCQAMLGADSDAQRLVAEAAGQMVGRIDPDDRAACHARLSACLSHLGEEAISRTHLEEARKHRAEYSAFQSQLREQLYEVLDDGTGK